MKKEVFNALESIQQKDIKSGLCDVVSRNEEEFRKVGITLEGIANLLEMKENAERHPNPTNFQIYDHATADYIFTNRNNPDVELLNDRERCFCTALRVHDSDEKNYERKVNEFSELASNILDKVNEQLIGEQAEAGMWTEVKSRIGSAVGVVKTLLSEKAATERKLASATVKADENGLITFTGLKKLASDGKTVLHQIQANQDISYSTGNILKGDIGGWIESPDNLEGNAWVGENAEVYNAARVINSSVWGNSIVNGKATVMGDSLVDGNSLITDSATVKDRSIIIGNVKISGPAIVEKSPVLGYSTVSGNSYIRDCQCDINAHIVDSTIVNAHLSGDMYFQSQKITNEGNPNVCYCPYYLEPKLLEGELINKLRANQNEGLKGALLFQAEGKEFIADLQLTKREDAAESDMKVAVLNPVVRCNGINYDGQKIVDGLECLYRDLVNVPRECLSDMLSGSPRGLNQKGYYAIHQVDGEFVVQDVGERISNIDIYPHRGGGTAIRCQIDGVQQGSKMLSEEDALRPNDNMDRYGLVVSYFADAFQVQPERSYSLGR